MRLLEASPTTYREVYFEGRKMPTNRGQGLGREIAEAIETDTDTGDIIKDAVIAQLPKYEHRDKEFRMTIPGKEPVPLLIKPDSLKKDYSAVIEYKTGVEPWTQNKVDRDDQLTFYATGIYVLVKKIPKLDLYWAETAMDMEDINNPGERIMFNMPQLTGRIERFETTRTIKDVLKMQVRMRAAWREIGRMVENELV